MNTSSISLEKISAAITWIIVTGFSLYIMWESEKFSLIHIIVTLLLCLIFFGLWTYVTKESEAASHSVKRLLVAILLYFVIIAIYFMIPVTFVAIFMVIFSAVTRYFMSFRNAMYFGIFPCHVATSRPIGCPS
jgi:two-component system sensor histidine kinase DesK